VSLKAQQREGESSVAENKAVDAAIVLRSPHGPCGAPAQGTKAQHACAERANGLRLGTRRYKRGLRTAVRLAVDPSVK